MKRFLPILAGAVCILLFQSCGEEGPGAEKEETADATPTEAVTETEDLTPVERPETRQGLISFFSGDVFIHHDGDEYFAQIGDLVEVEDVLIVEAASYCEVQFGDSAVVRIEENTEVAMKDISLSPGETDIDLNMKSGSVLCKVKKLAGAEEFKVKTQTAVCGVRGTAFSVSADGGNNTVLAVKDGSVAVLPASVDIDSLKEQAGEENEELMAILEDLEESAPVVSANEEVNLDEQTMKETEEAARTVATAVEEIAEEAKTEKKIDPAKLASLSKAVEETKKAVRKKVAEPRQVSLVNKEKLDKIDKIAMIDIAPAAEQELVKVAVQAEPAGTEITVNGKEVGTGSFSGIYPAGKELAIHLSNPGYKDHTIEITASKETGKLYKVKLVQAVSAEKAEGRTGDGSAAADGKPDSGAGEQTASGGGAADGTGNAGGGDETGTGDRTAGGKGAVAAKSTDTETGGEETAMGAVEITTQPKDAAVMLGGKQVATGVYRGRHEAGKTLTFTVTRQGYARQTVDVRVTEGGVHRTVALRLLPVEVDAAVSGKPIVGNLTTAGNRIIAADGGGAVFAVSTAGRVLWRVDTKNNPNENSSPSVIGGRVYFSGSKELVVIDSASGRVLNRTALDSASAHLFGRRVMEMDGTVYFPAHGAIKVFDPKSGAFTREIPVPKGSRMTPAVWKGKLVVANLEGSLLILDPGAKNPVQASVSTAAVQPIAIAPTVVGDLAVFSGRKGTMVCVDLASEKILWEKKLPGNASVFTDIACNGKGLYAYTKGTIFALSLESGSEMFPAVDNAASPPLCAGDRFYYGAGNYLAYRRSSDGAVIGEIQVSGPIVTRPAAAGRKIVAGTSAGHILIMNP